MVSIIYVNSKMTSDMDDMDIRCRYLLMDEHQVTKVLSNEVQEAPEYRSMLFETNGQCYCFLDLTKWNSEHAFKLMETADKQSHVDVHRYDSEGIGVVGCPNVMLLRHGLVNPKFRRRCRRALGTTDIPCYLSLNENIAVIRTSDAVIKFFNTECFSAKRRFESSCNTLKVLGQHLTYRLFKPEYDSNQRLGIIRMPDLGTTALDCILIDKKNENLRPKSEADALLVFGKLIQAVKPLHDKRIAHLDLKMENFMCIIHDNSMTHPETKLVVVDFEFSQRCDAKLRDNGTGPYMAPEYVTLEYEVLSDHGAKADVFALGVLLCCLLFDVSLQRNPNDSQYRWINKNGLEEWIKRYNLRTVGREIVSSDTVALLERMIAADPNKRPTLDSLDKMFNG